MPLKQSRQRPNSSKIKEGLWSLDRYILLISGYTDKIIMPYDVIEMICKYTMTRKECLVKVVSLGYNTVGKSSIIERYIKNDFNDPRISIPSEFLTKYHDINECLRLQFQIWDNSGQHKYRSMSPIYYRGMDAAFLVYDISQRETFQGANSWLKELERSVIIDDVVVILVGNKCDLEDQRQVTKNEAEQYAMDNKLLYIETSAKTGHNIQQLFAMMAEAMLERLDLNWKESKALQDELDEAKVYNTQQKTTAASSYYESCNIL